VIVDERERRSGVPDVLKDLGARIEFRLLDVGDYVVGETAIERKTVDDYVSSLFSGRLFEQAGRLTESYAAPLIIVEGDLQASLERLSRPRVFWGSMMSLVLQYNVRPFFTLNAEQTAELIFTCALHVSSKRGSAPPVIVKKPRISSQAQMQLLVVESLPMIGPRLARKLLERFGTVRRVFGASLTELAVRGGIGRARAQRVASILDLPYRRGPVVEHQSSLRPEE
jgi:DNA excision repair protein ERCC-4